MNCHEAYLWMLEAEEPTASPPAPIAEHLRGCLKCRRRQERVLGLLTSVRTLPGPPENPQVRDEVKELVRQLPVGPAGMPPPRVLPFRRWLIPTGIAATAAAAVLLLGLISVLLVHFFHPPAQQGDPTLLANHPNKHSWKDGELRSKLLSETLKLAEVETPLERLHALTDMAVDLEMESVTQANQMDDADMLRLAALYERVLDEGILLQARVLPPDQRPKELALLLAVLRTEETEARATAQQRPAAAEPLQRVAAAAGKAKDLLESPQLVKWPAPKPIQRPLPQQALLETLVLRGLALANENDPLKRAEVCQDLANNLWEQTIAEASKGDNDGDEMTKLGASLDVVMERAVHGNLKRVEATRKPECDEFRKGLESMLNRWKNQMQTAPDRSRPDLEHVFKKASRFSSFNNGPPHFNKDMNRGERDKFKGKRSALLRLLHQGTPM